MSRYPALIFPLVGEGEMFAERLVVRFGVEAGAVDDIQQRGIGDAASAEAKLGGSLGADAGKGEAAVGIGRCSEQRSANIPKRFLAAMPFPARQDFHIAR